MSSTPAPVDSGPATTDVCTVAEIARWLGVNRKTVYDAVMRREIPSARLGRRVLLSRSAINAWLAGATVVPPRRGVGRVTAG